VNTFLGLFDADLLSATMRVSTPVLLAALGGLMSMRAGTFNLALEGQMLVGAFFAIAAAQFSGNTWIGVVAGAVAGIVLSGVFALAVLRFEANDIVTSVAVNLLALGLTGFLLKAMFGTSGVFRPEHFEPLPAWRIPWIEEIPVFGRMLSGQTPLVYAGLALALVTGVVLYRMPFGLAVRSVGEQPDAARTAGIPPTRTKLAAVLISGLLCGLGGAHLALGYASEFSEAMTQGRGFTAFIAAVFGQLDPGMTLLVSLLFGFADALGLRLQLQGVGLPSSIIQMFPYVLALVALTLSSAVGVRRRGRARQREMSV
jgi:simple sugar transport system permease protein